jgi:hypothetical protein
MECPPLKGAMGDDKLCFRTRIKVISKLIGHPSRGFGFSKNLNLLLRSGINDCALHPRENALNHRHDYGLPRGCDHHHGYGRLRHHGCGLNRHLLNGGLHLRYERRHYHPWLTAEPGLHGCGRRQVRVNDRHRVSRNRLLLIL